MKVLDVFFSKKMNKDKEYLYSKEYVLFFIYSLILEKGIRNINDILNEIDNHYGDHAFPPKKCLPLLMIILLFIMMIAICILRKSIFLEDI